MMKRRRSAAAGAGMGMAMVLIGLLFFPMAAAALQLGDPAPPLDVSTWIQGKPVRLSAERDKRIYVVEFWEPDCPHCRESIPFLNMLHETYADQGVVVVGISGDSTENIRQFLDGSEEPVAYTVGADAENRSDLAYMGGFGIEGVPHAFVVDRRGRIAWEGHPMEGLDEALAQMVAGRYDLDHRIRVDTAEKLFNAYQYLARFTRETDLLRRLGRRIAALAWHDAPLLGRLADHIASADGLHDPDLILALRAVERALAIQPDPDADWAETRKALMVRLGRPANGARPASKDRNHP
jgi:peroxiredoxin